QLGGESVLAVFLWGGVFRPRISLRSNQFSEVASAGGSRREREAAQGIVGGGATGSGAHPGRGEAGQCGYDGARESDRISDRCTLVSQSPASPGAGRAEWSLQVTAKLRAPGEAG